MTEPARHYHAVEMEEGAGARVKRLFPVTGLRHIDPFVLLDEFFIGPDTGFPAHPHRGFEAITYLFAGGMHHLDNLGNDSTVQAGGAQVFCAGSGIVHSEAPVGTETAHGIQLWINTAQIDKDLPPSYQQVDAAELPLQQLPFGRVCTIVGPGSPIQLHTSVLYHDVQLERDGEYHLTVPAHHSGLLYTVVGTPEVQEEKLTEGVALPVAGGTTLTIYAAQPCRFISVSGQPHGGPIVQHGGFVD